MVILESLRAFNKLLCFNLIPSEAIFEDPQTGEQGLLQRIAPFLLHPSMQVREACLNFINILRDSNGIIVSKAKVYCVLRPLIRPYLRNGEQDIQFVTNSQLAEQLTLLRAPLSRDTFERLTRSPDALPNLSESDVYATELLEPSIAKIRGSVDSYVQSIRGRLKRALQATAR